MASEFDPADEEASPWGSKWFVASAGVLGVIVALAVLLVVSNLLGGSPQPQSAADGDALVAGQPADPAAVESDSVCGLADVELTGTVDAPPTAEWTLLGTIAVPQRDGVGPGVIEDDGFRYCYAHTPEGALFAAVNTTGMGGTNLLEKKAAERSIAAGPGRDAAIRDANDGITSTRGDDLRLQVAGFRVLSYTGSRATVDLAYQLNTGATAAWALDLVWEDGDWKFLLTDEGDPPSLPTRIPDLSGYILWGGA